MKILDFTSTHIQSAEKLALDSYRAERNHVQSLPESVQIPGLLGFAENKLGVAAFEDERMLGYLCAVSPFNAFNTGASGTFSPIHANAADQTLNPDARADLYSRLYQAAADKWVRAGIISHAIALYAHDEAGISALFSYGFGLRCIDAVKSMDDSIASNITGITFRELDKSEAAVIRPLRKQLSEHLGGSPCFMYSTPEEFSDWLERAEKRDSRLFAAFEENSPAAFIEIKNGGENFIAESDDMKNICGAYCLPEFRGQKLVQALIMYAQNNLGEKIRRLGVDYESINPNAAHFWRKMFTPYTKSLVRRIDESVLRLSERK